MMVMYPRCIEVMKFKNVYYHFCQGNFSWGLCTKCQCYLQPEYYILPYQFQFEINYNVNDDFLHAFAAGFDVTEKLGLSKLFNKIMPCSLSDY